MSLEKTIAHDLLSIGAVFLRPDEPFTWASGIKSPVYCDNRLILTAPDVRTEVETALMQTIRREYPDAEVLMGTSTAGIAHAAITAQMMGLPMGYVRSSSKDHGRQNRIEGKLEPGQKVVVVEDLISTGGSCIEVVEARITYLAYAPEIAAVMLQRQQASAIIDARKMIVDGAVGMVEMALDRLNENKVVELDDERKAAMVSNLLVVLCGNRDAQPIVNSGSLY